MESDFLNTFLAIITKTLSLCDNDTITSILLKFKYQLLFVFNTLEDTYIDKNFNFDKLYIGSKITSEIQNRGIDEYEFYINEYLDNFLNNQIISLIDNSDNLSENISKIEITKIIVRSILLFLKREEVTKFQTLLDTILSNFIDDENTKNEILNDIFINYNTDLELPNILTFYPNRGR